MSSKKLIVNNVATVFGSKLIILCLGIILPRLLITSYGSEMNGLLATITQIFTYLVLVEAGIGNSTVNALYKPLGENDYAQANEVISEAHRYYRKVSVIYGLCIAAFAIIYPLVAQTTINRWLIFGIIILQGAASFISYYFSAVYFQLLTAAGRRYVNENVSLITYVVVSVAKIILIAAGCNVLVVQISHFVINVIKIPLIIWYCRKKFEWLDISVTPKMKRLKERGAFLVHELSTTIFNNTDILLISSFCSFAMSSVYSIYNLIYSSLTAVLATVNSSLSFLLGQAQYKGKEQLTQTYDLYRIIYVSCAFVVFTIATVMVVPFVKLYTAGVTDINYVVGGLPMLFAAINMLSGWRATAALLITVSGHASKTQVRSIAETVINIVTSVVLVNLYGMKGVLWGTIIALLYRSNDIVIYANRRILQRSAAKEYLVLIVFSALFLLINFVCGRMGIAAINYLSFFAQAFCVGIVTLFIYGIAAILLSRELRRGIARVLRRKKQQA